MKRRRSGYHCLVWTVFALAPVHVQATHDLPDLVFLPGGSYVAGDVRGVGGAGESPAHAVTLTGFYLSRTEVTFADYDEFSDATGRARPSDNGWGRGDRPVIDVSWLDAVEYCNWLSAQEGLEPFYVVNADGVEPNWFSTGYRLPTEAEWEYAAAGGETALVVSDPGAAWLQGSSGGRTRPVGTGTPGPLGLHDMLGNVWEWCNDWYGAYTASAVVNPRGPVSGQYRVLRGGSWYDLAVNVRITARSWHPPTRRLPMVGFRVARSAELPPESVGE